MDTQDETEFARTYNQLLSNKKKYVFVFFLNDITPHVSYFVCRESQELMHHIGLHVAEGRGAKVMSQVSFDAKDSGDVSQSGLSSTDGDSE